MKLKIKIADKVIELEHSYPELRRYCEDYLVEQEVADVSLSWTEQEIQSEGAGELSGFSMGYLETLTALRKIAEWIPAQNRVVFHGAAITFEEQGFLFTAPSGTGKSTHISLWKRMLGDAVDIVNGDKPILEWNQSGEEPQTRVYGTPWAGKERWQKNRSAVLNGICVVQQSKKNRIQRLTASEALNKIASQIYLPRQMEALGLTLELLGKILECVPVYLLECDISRDAVRCSFEALTGLEYEKYEVKRDED